MFVCTSSIKLLLSSVCLLSLSSLSTIRAFSTPPIISRTSSLLSHQTSCTLHMSPKHIVIIGSGIQGTSVAYHLHKKSSSSLPPESTITLLEAQSPASAASGKGGGFMARSWGSGPTVALHELSFDMYEALCKELEVTSYRKLPVLSVAPGRGGDDDGMIHGMNSQLKQMMPSWLDGSVGRISPMGLGDDTAQVTPKEFVDKMLDCMLNKKNDDGNDNGVVVKLVLGTCTGIEYRQEEENSDGSKTVTAVKYNTQNDGNIEEHTLQATDVIVSAGPWSCQAQDWFDNAVQLPMEGVKSTSIVWKPPANNKEVDATALFCGEDHRFGTHLEVYPRPDGTIYICGIGGSDYISTEELQSSAFLEECPPRSDRADAATAAFTTMSKTYREDGELMTVQACMRPCPPDAMPYMGKVPGYNGAYINAGHNCWGIAWAPACGRAMAELVLDGECKCMNLKPFDPARFTSSGGRGGRGRKKGSLNVGEQW